MPRPAALLCSLAALLAAQPILAGEEEFVAVDPATLVQVDGRTMVIAAYGVILALVAAYALLLWAQERSLARRVRELERRLAAGKEGNP
jgi:ABC-type uncharacterized transport system permease subunit